MFYPKTLYKRPPEKNDKVNYTHYVYVLGDSGYAKTAVSNQYLSMDSDD